jgi:hypothetical protein
MKAIFVTSLVSASISLFAIFGLSAMTIIPGHGSESWRGQLMLTVGIFLVGWLCIAFWVRPRQHPVLLPRWLGRLLVFIGIVYTLVTLIFVLG